MTVELLVPLVLLTMELLVELLVSLALLALDLAPLPVQPLVSLVLLTV